MFSLYFHTQRVKALFLWMPAAPWVPQCAKSVPATEISRSCPGLLKRGTQGDRLHKGTQCTVLRNTEYLKGVGEREKPHLLIVFSSPFCFVEAAKRMMSGSLQFWHFNVWL